MEKEKAKSKKWIIAVILIIIVAIAIAIYFNVFSIPTGLIAGTTTNEATKTEVPSTPTVTVTGTEILNKEFTETLTYYESVELEPGRYVIQITTDKKVTIMIYDELHFEEWQQGKFPNLITGSGTSTDNFISRFDVKSGQGGNYYIVLVGTGDASIKLKLIQEIKI